MGQKQAIRNDLKTAKVAQWKDYSIQNLSNLKSRVGQTTPWLEHRGKQSPGSRWLTPGGHISLCFSKSNPPVSSQL